VLRQFFRFARAHRIVLVDPTREITAKEPRAFRGTTLTLDQQRALFRRWTIGPGVHPHEAFVGMFAHCTAPPALKARGLRITHVDQQAHAVRLGKRPHPVPLDPASWEALQRCLVHRHAWPTENPHVMVTKGTKAGRAPASTAYLSTSSTTAGSHHE
jgi:hypothetical protein